MTDPQITDTSMRYPVTPLLVFTVALQLPGPVPRPERRRPDRCPWGETALLGPNGSGKIHHPSQGVERFGVSHSGMFTAFGEPITEDTLEDEQALHR